MSLRGIFFDAAGVFYRRPESTRKYVAKLLAEKGLVAELSDRDRAAQTALRSEANRGHISSDAYWDHVLLMHGVAAAEERRVMVGKISDYANHVLPIPGGREALAGLKQRGFVLGIVTDTMYPLEWKMRWLTRVGVAEFIDVVACSTVLGAHKPDSAIYLNALQQAGLTPGEAAFVGHAADELEGAHRAGMVTVAVHHDEGAIADYYAESLVDLLNVPVFAKSAPRQAQALCADIEAVFIDVGNTLRVVEADEPYQAQARQQLAALVGAPESPEAFCQRLDERYAAYRAWARATLSEAREKELWTRWLLPDWPPDRIGLLAGELTSLYRKTMGRRRARADTRKVVVELNKRGYRLGILSNTITEGEIPRWLEEDGLRPYFTTVILSSLFGRRKPDPEIFLEAARSAGVTPGRAAYVGDNPSRDVLGCRRAGFGMAIIMIEPANPKNRDLMGENKPDLVIHNLIELLNILPARQAPAKFDARASHV
jgi:putative hydrolase of the HAD superfamily